MVLDNFNIEGLKIIEKEVFGDWECKISDDDNDGRYSEEFQYITFEHDGVEVFVGFTLTISGNYYYVPESYMQPAESEVNITDVDVNIDCVLVNDDEVSSLNFKSELEKAIEKLLEEDYTLL